MKFTYFKQEKSRLILAVVIIAIAMIPKGYGQSGWGGEGAGASGTVSVDAGIASKDAADTGGGDGGWGMEGTPTENQVIKKAPYVRFLPPFDSMREIIFYENIIEDESCENCGSDSLYYRAKKMLVQRLGIDGYKKMVAEDKIADRIVLVVTTPMICRYGKYNKKQEGMLEYRLTLRFKDSRYKYQFGNFVHVEVEDGLKAKVARTYHEHYMKLKKGFQFTDQFLLAADFEVKEVVAGLKKSLLEPYLPDEDDW